MPIGNETSLQEMFNAMQRQYEEYLRNMLRRDELFYRGMQYNVPLQYVGNTEPDSTLEYTEE